MKNFFLCVCVSVCLQGATSHRTKPSLWFFLHLPLRQWMCGWGCVFFFRVSDFVDYPIKTFLFRPGKSARVPDNNNFTQNCNSGFNDRHFHFYNLLLFTEFGLIWQFDPTTISPCHAIEFFLVVEFTFEGKTDSISECSKASHSIESSKKILWFVCSTGGGRSDDLFYYVLFVRSLFIMNFEVN